MPEVYCPAITDPLKLMYSIPHKNTIFLVPLYHKVQDYSLPIPIVNLEALEIEKNILNPLR
jgi:hypothetical protein